MRRKMDPMKHIICERCDSIDMSVMVNREGTRVVVYCRKCHQLMYTIGAKGNQGKYKPDWENVQTAKEQD